MDPELCCVWSNGGTLIVDERYMLLHVIGTVHDYSSSEIPMIL